MLVPMSKVHIIGHRRRLDDALGALQHLGLVHLIDVTQDRSVRLPPLAVDEEHLRELEEARYLGTRIESYLALLPEPLPLDPGPPLALEELRRQIELVGPPLEQLAHRLEDLTVERETLPRHLETLRKLLPLVPELTAFEGYDTMAVVLDARHAEALAELNARLGEALADNFEIISDRVDESSVGAVVVFPKQARAQVEAICGHEHVSRMRLPRDYESVPFRQAISAMETRLRSLEHETDDLHREIEDLIRPHADWPVTASHLGARREQLQAIRKLGATPHTFVVSGWVPTGRIDLLRDALLERVGPDLVVEVVEPEQDETPPVEMQNRPAAQPFQPLVRLLSIPRYGTLDPTALMTLFLPFFFGMMLGDVVYGVVIGLLALGVRLRSPSSTVRDFARVFVHSAVWTVIWGVVYGEFLGDLGRRWFGMSPLWIDREHALEPLLVFALAVGGAHVLLGLVLGVWQARRARDRHTLWERVGQLVALMGLFLVTGVFAGLLPEGTMTPAVAAIVVGLVLLIGLGGPMGALLGPLELIGTIGNVLSYLRLAAIGLASVYLARVANELGAAAPVWLGVIVAALFHALNLVLGAFSPTIQALRLHYVEFFQKFYVEGGDAYRPFGADTQPEEAPGDRRAEQRGVKQWS